MSTTGLGGRQEDTSDMMRKILAVVFAGALAIGIAAPAFADSNGSNGYEGQPGNQGNGSNGYEGQPGNQGG